LSRSSTWATRSTRDDWKLFQKFLLKLFAKIGELLLQVGNRLLQARHFTFQTRDSLAVG
jgi:hypothetical protein